MRRTRRAVGSVYWRSQLFTAIGSTPSRSATSLCRKLLSDSASRQRSFEERLEALLQVNRGKPVVREPLKFADTDVLFALADFPEPYRFHMTAGSRFAAPPQTLSASILVGRKRTTTLPGGPAAASYQPSADR